MTVAWLVLGPAVSSSGTASVSVISVMPLYHQSLQSPAVSSSPPPFSCQPLCCKRFVGAA